MNLIQDSSISYPGKDWKLIFLDIRRKKPYLFTSLLTGISTSVYRQKKKYLLKVYPFPLLLFHWTWYLKIYSYAIGSLSLSQQIINLQFCSTIWSPPINFCLYTCYFTSPLPKSPGRMSKCHALFLCNLMLLNLILSLGSWIRLGAEGTESKQLKRPKYFSCNAMESAWCYLCSCNTKWKNYTFNALTGWNFAQQIVRPIRSFANPVGSFNNMAECPLWKI